MLCPNGWHQHRPTGTTLDSDWQSPATTTIYLRRRQELPPEAIQELERYFELLRAYYGIPEDQPVFPSKPKSKDQRAKPAMNAKNCSDHPWRGDL